MKIYRPVKTNYKAQAFGENAPCVKLIGKEPIRPFQVITPGTETCPVGYTKFYPAVGMRGHNGEDWTAYHGEPVYFPVIADVEWEAATEVDKDGGIGVRVRSKTPVALESLPAQAEGSLNMIKAQYDANGGKVYLVFLFWHLKAPNVYDKQPVVPGQLIGWADSTGASSGDHVHFAMKVSSDTSWFTLDGDNGYAGAIDFSAWYENQFINDVVPFAFHTDFGFGSVGDDVKKLQARLGVVQLGIFGPLTRAAVKGYQSAHGIPNTGYVGPLTRASLNQ